MRESESVRKLNDQRSSLYLDVPEACNATSYKKLSWMDFVLNDRDRRVLSMPDITAMARSFNLKHASIHSHTPQHQRINVTNARRHTRLQAPSRTHTCTYIHTYIHTYTHMYIHTFIHTHTYIHPHTYILTTYTLNRYIHTSTLTYLFERRVERSQSHHSTLHVDLGARPFIPREAHTVTFLVRVEIPRLRFLRLSIPSCLSLRLPISSLC
jgi:hypothetical protein